MRNQIKSKSCVNQCNHFIDFLFDFPNFDATNNVSPINFCVTDRQNQNMTRHTQQAMGHNSVGLLSYRVAHTIF